MKKGAVISWFVFILLFCNNCFSEDSISKSERIFPKNHIKYNFLPLITHTITFSYEREIAKRFSIEFEGGYIFPLHQPSYWYDIISKSPSPLWPSQGYLGRGSLRYFLIKNVERKSVFFTGFSILYKYRYYKNQMFDDYGTRMSSYNNHIVQSEVNNFFAGEIQIGIRTYSSKYKHFFIEKSISFGIGIENSVTEVSKLYWGSHPDPSFIGTHSENSDTYFSFNPCFKIGYAF